VGSGRADLVAEAKTSGVHNLVHDPGSVNSMFKNGEWWLQIKMDHPHKAIELIEAYKRITGVSLCDVCYRLDIDDPEGLKRRPLIA